jgi:hypothetical protein
MLDMRPHRAIVFEANGIEAFVLVARLRGGSAAGGEVYSFGCRFRHGGHVIGFEVRVES